MGKTAGKIGRLLQRVNFIGRLNETKFQKQIEINRGVEEVLTDILARLAISEGLQDVLSDDLEALKKSNFDYQIKSLGSNLDYTQEIIMLLGSRIDKLENTAWRRFYRWIFGRK